VLVLTDKVEPLGQLPDFTIGNTDFAVKPFHPAELVLRIRRLLFNWQIASRESGIMAYEDLKLDVSRHEVLADGRTVHLTATEFKLLATLAQRRGRLLQDVCDYSNSSQLFTRTIDTHMRRLRNKLGPAQWHLETVRGVGFRFREKPAGESWTPATFGRRRGRVDGLANGRKRSRPWV
jgi:two-component system phosphate regulon response regulator PhoB